MLKCVSGKHTKIRSITHNSSNIITTEQLVSHRKKARDSNSALIVRSRRLFKPLDDLKNPFSGWRDELLPNLNLH